MDSRKDRHSNKRLNRGHKNGRGHRSLRWLLLICLLGVAFLWQRPAFSPTETETPAPATALQGKRELLDFDMIDFDRGWALYSDGAMMTEDGGANWTKAKDSDMNSMVADRDQPDPNENFIDWTLGTPPVLSTITMEDEEYRVRKTKFLSERIGWVMLFETEDLESLLWVTVDHGETWHSEVTAGMRTAMVNERERLSDITKEAQYYSENKIAKEVIKRGWTLIPSTSSAGDIIMVRHHEPSQLTWQDKTYTLQKFGAGYYAYLPISISTNPGKYMIGDQQLTITAKKFDTQYLKVTKQMEAMRQDTARIQADQKKINLARSNTQPEFLFTSEFIQPLEGRLTTPYGYTRYVNDKLDSRHMAIDIAAKEGTPIHATNGGIVVLAEPLYLAGNSIYIDHGMGLFSQYGHMSKLLVSEGDQVKQGDVIGLVGSTGFSTGPHLHFAFWAHNVPVNPNLFFGTTPFHWLSSE